MDVLLRSEGSSIGSSKLHLEKNELLDAVMGVVGDLCICREGSGLRSRCEASWWLLLDAVGKLSGPIFRGGSLRGSNCFLPWLLFFSCSMLEMPT